MGRRVRRRAGNKKAGLPRPSVNSLVRIFLLTWPYAGHHDPRQSLKTGHLFEVHPLIRLEAAAGAAGDFREILAGGLAEALGIK